MRASEKNSTDAGPCCDLSSGRFSGRPVVRSMAAAAMDANKGKGCRSCTGRAVHGAVHLPFSNPKAAVVQMEAKCNHIFCGVPTF